MAQKAAQSASGPAAIVALEQHLPESARIITDELAPQILPFGVRASVWLIPQLISLDRMVSWSEKRTPGVWGGFLCRKRYIDEKVAERVNNAPTKCPSCNGAITQPILRGMESINCEYCGDVIRL